MKVKDLIRELEKFEPELIVSQSTYDCYECHDAQIFPEVETCFINVDRNGQNIFSDSLTKEEIDEYKKKGFKEEFRLLL